MLDRTDVTVDLLLVTLCYIMMLYKWIELHCIALFKSELKLNFYEVTMHTLSTYTYCIVT